VSGGNSRNSKPQKTSAKAEAANSTAAPSVAPAPAQRAKKKAESKKTRVAEFSEFRQRMNERILGEDNQVVRRFFALDTQTYKPGALDVKTKELLGLVASLVLRCDDCISYHLAQCREAGVRRDEFFETFTVGLVVGGSIVIPHLRRAVDFLDQLEAD
jgi:AhpD family alkylhydroperoxidase